MAVFFFFLNDAKLEKNRRWSGRCRETRLSHQKFAKRVPNSPDAWTKEIVVSIELQQGELTRISFMPFSLFPYSRQL